MSDESPESRRCQEVFLSHLDGLYGYAMALCRDRSTAEDLVQETYTQAASHFRELRHDQNLKGWLFKILRNLWLKTLRRERSGPEFVALDDVNISRWAFDTTGDPELLYVRIWEREEIRAALELLPTIHREVIVQRDIEGFSYKEMAELLDCPVGTVMSRLARGRALLKQALLNRQHSEPKRGVNGGS